MKWTLLKKWFVPANLDFDDFTSFWPKDLQKFIFEDRFAFEEITSGQSTVFKSWDQKNSVGCCGFTCQFPMTKINQPHLIGNLNTPNVLEGIPSVLPIES